MVSQDYKSSQYSRVMPANITPRMHCVLMCKPYIRLLCNLCVTLTNVCVCGLWIWIFGLFFSHSVYLCPVDECTS